MKQKFISLALTFFCLFTLSSCAQETLSYSDFPSVSNETFFVQSEEKYGVYVFSYNCYYCNSIKNTVLTYLENYEKNPSNLLKIYTFDIGIYDSYLQGYLPPDGYTLEEAYADCLAKSLGSTSFDDLYLYGTPTLYIFERNNDGKPALIDEKIGAQNVKNYLTIETSNYLYLIISLSVALLVSGLIVILLIYLKRRKKDEQTKN